jgi:enamine deaminase RidA (YjgF/YER057c/UK114 family)
MRKLTVLPLLLLAITYSYAQSAASNVQLINPPTVAAPHGYSQAAVVDLGNCKMVILSGQVALDAQGNLTGGNDIAKQTEQVFQNIKAIITAAGGNMSHLVKLGYFVKDVSALPALRAIRDRFVNTQNPPASTLVQVNNLFRADVLIEIEATAIIPK